jgi:hypothetical protein
MKYSGWSGKSWLLAIAATLALGGCAAPNGTAGSGGVTMVKVGGHERPELHVGFLPVTCHLTCPVTDFATRTSTSTRFVSQRFTDFPTVVDAMKSGRLDASFMIAPLAMKIISATATARQ